MQPYGRRQRSRDSVSQIDSMISRIWRESAQRLAGRVRGRVFTAAASHLQNEHVLPEVVAVFEDDADGVFGERGAVGPFELQPQRLLLGRHHFALLDLDASTRCLFLQVQIEVHQWLCVCVPPRGLRPWVQDRTGPWNPAAGRTTAGPPVSGEAGTPLRTARNFKLQR